MAISVRGSACTCKDPAGAKSPQSNTLCLAKIRCTGLVTAYLAIPAEPGQMNPEEVELDE
jgi:hypothetical protein